MLVIHASTASTSTADTATDSHRGATCSRHVNSALVYVDRDSSSLRSNHDGASWPTVTRPSLGAT
jgi:hypothetical protein